MSELESYIRAKKSGQLRPLNQLDHGVVFIAPNGSRFAVVRHVLNVTHVRGVSFKIQGSLSSMKSDTMVLMGDSHGRFSLQGR